MITKIVSVLIEILLKVLEGLTNQIGGSMHLTLARWPNMLRGLS